MRALVLLTIVTLSLTLFAAKDPVVAKVGEKAITLSEFNRRFLDLQRATANPPSPNVFLEDLIRYEVGLREAQRRKLERNPLVQQRLEQALYNALLEVDLSKELESIKISNRDLQNYYRANPEIKTRHILVKANVGATEAQRAKAVAKAKKILAQVKKSPKAFGKIANKSSEEKESAKAGGNIGWVRRYEVPDPYYETAKKLKRLEISGIVETQHGFHIIQNTGQKKYAQVDKTNLRSQVFAEKRKVVLDKYFAGLKRNYKIQSFPNKLTR
jgi:peptidyl-prolyl cis-trans isomerase C/peptidyl-prolyl cis-trans isomerase D